MKRFLCLLACCVCFLAAGAVPAAAEEDGPKFIKWVDCNVTSDIMKKAFDLDVKYHGSEKDFRFVDALAYLATKNGNKFSVKKDTENLAKLVKHVEQGGKISDLYGDNKYYRYYVESFTALFAGYVGNYRTEDSEDIRYGMKAYFPFAKGYWYNHYDDFGNSRSFGFKRKHLGHDIMGAVGTPIVAVEGGTVQELGWNRYGGWRIGIRTKDTKRYYYYAHLRKDRPYAAGLKKGDTVEAGQVIGYLGNTGYSNKENQNLKTGQPHLHIGLQLIFDESQVQGNNEIWVDFYEISKFLAPYRIAVEKDAETKEYRSIDRRIGLE